MEILWGISDCLLRQQGVADLFAVKGLFGHKDVKSGAEDPESLPEAGEIRPFKSFRPAVVSILDNGWSWGMRLSEIVEKGGGAGHPEGSCGCRIKTAAQGRWARRQKAGLVVSFLGRK
jgi:hypothetical protein